MIVGIDNIAMMAAIGVREEGVGRNGVDSGGGRIYSNTKRYVRWQILECQVTGAGRCMYVHGMAYMCGIYLRSKHLLPCSLLRCQPPSPRAGSRCRYGHNRLHISMQSSQPTITERQRQREIDQVRDTQRRMGMVQGKAERVRSV
jgi:hypothetical protein